MTSAFDRGRSHADARRFASARRAFVRAIREGVQAPWACQELVRTYIATGRSVDAESVLRDVLAPGSPLQDHALGYLYRRTGRGAEAREHFERAARARPVFWPARNELGWLEHRAGRSREGARMLESAARQFASCGDVWGEATAITHLATIAREQFKLSDALVLLARAADLKRACGDQLGLATTFHARAQVHQFRSEPLAGQAAYHSALAIQRRIRFTEGIAASLNGLGVVHLDLGEVTEAMAAFREALGHYRRLGSAFKAHQAAALVNVALAYELEGDLGAVTRTMRRALTLTDDSSTLPGVREIASERLGRNLLLRGRPREALETIGPATAIAATSAMARLWTGHLRAECHLALDEPNAAVTAAQATLRQARPDSTTSTLVAEREAVRAVLGHARVAAGHRAAGLRTLRQAVATLGHLVDEQRSRDARLGLADRLREVEDSLVLALAVGPGASAREAWLAASHGKARELSGHWQHVAQEGSRRQGRLLAKLEDEIRRIAATASLEDGASARLAQLKQDYKTAVNEVGMSRRTSPDESMASGAATLELPSGVAVIEYHSCARTTLVFTLQTDRVVVTDLGIPRHALIRRVARLVSPLRSASTGRDAAPALLSFDVALAHRLHRELVAPALRTLDASIERLIIVPDGPLHGLPFGLLVTALRSTGASDPFAWYGAQEYLGARFLLSHAPASRFLRTAMPRPLDARALVLAHAPSRPTTLHVEDGLRTIGPLPELENEVQAITRALPRARVLVGSRATPEAYCENAGNTDVIHVAAHAFCDAGIPDLSGLVLANGDGGGGVDLLTARRIASVRLTASLVTVSACEAGRGRTWQREGVLGIARAFQQAGARTVLASPWPVEDRAGAALLSAFHSSWQRDRDAPLALRMGQRAVQALGGMRAHPYFWASFILSDCTLPTEPTPAARPGRAWRRALGLELSG